MFYIDSTAQFSLVPFQGPKGHLWPVVTILDSAGRREFTEGWVGDWPENAAVKLEIPGRKKAEFPCGERQGAAIRPLRGQLRFSCSVDHFSGMGAKHELGHSTSYI